MYLALWYLLHLDRNVCCYWECLFKHRCKVQTEMKQCPFRCRCPYHNISPLSVTLKFQLTLCHVQMEMKQCLFRDRCNVQMEMKQCPFRCRCYVHMEMKQCPSKHRCPYDNISPLSLILSFNSQMEMKQCCLDVDVMFKMEMKQCPF